MMYMSVVINYNESTALHFVSIAVSVHCTFLQITHIKILPSCLH